MTRLPRRFSAYILGPDRLQLIEDQSDALNANLGGTALGQGSHAGTFNLASVAGATYVHGSVGGDAVSGALTLAGGFALNADGTVRDLAGDRATMSPLPHCLALVFWARAITSRPLHRRTRNPVAPPRAPTHPSSTPYRCKSEPS
jgi:hypothetical protein